MITGKSGILEILTSDITAKRRKKYSRTTSGSSNLLYRASARGFGGSLEEGAQDVQSGAYNHVIRG